MATGAATVVARDRLPAARVLAETYLEHHPGQEFVVLVVDGTDETGDGYRIAGYDWLDLDPDAYLRLATCYGADDLIEAVRPLVLRQLLDRFEVAVLLDPETEVFAPLSEVTALAAEHDLVLTPALLAPLPDDGRDPAEAPGVFDPGFLAAGQGARGFLDFWAERARRKQPEPVPPRPERPVFDLVPGLFRHTVVRDPGLGVAYWNLHERGLGNVRLLHFTGYDPETPWLLSGTCSSKPRVLLSADARLRELADAHRDKVVRAGYRKDVRYRFDRLPDGSALTREMRRLFHAAWRKVERAEVEPDPLGRTVEKAPPHPFGEDRGLAFRQWLASPASPVEAAAGLNRLIMAVWAARIDLQAVFGDPVGSAGFRQWCTAHGTEEGLLPEWALPRDPAPVDDPVDEFGVNVAGYLTAELGLGEMGRIVHRVVRESGVPVVSVVEEHSLTKTVRTALDHPDTAGRPRFPVSVLAVNSDYTALLLNSHPEVGHHRYRIGLWAWELEEFPETMHAGFAHVDEVWTVSEFARRSIAAHSPVPVKVIPVPVLDPGPVTRPPREPGAPARFLFAFDFNSTGGRKNPWGVVTAFRRAFPGRDDVRLTIKATNGHLHTAAAERLRRAIGDDPRIELLDRYLGVDELAALYETSDAYVSLHRSEGFGLTVAEAMVRGLAVIATDYSSTTEFFTADCGWPIPYTMTEVGPGWVPYQQEAVWAEPDLDAAARALREVADDPAEARRRGAAAREHVLRTRSLDAAAAWMRDALRGAYETWRARGGDGPPGDDPLAPLDRAREALHWEPDPHSPSRVPLAPALRRVIRRALDHYDTHQRRILGRLTDGTREAIRRVQHRSDRQAETQARRLDAIERRLERLESPEDR
ncbi:glycosyltransferase [Amycolatopsis anabasis]|uniref:glycosyltransferase n=1 Tax=Amycolatopsis anabasis TaxID=1840409 RepID=UPI00131AE2BA|nr:glycosyltransferase [Amycolatopsis anabasis]